MSFYEDRPSASAIMASAKTYNKVVREVCELWERLHGGRRLEVSGQYPSDRYKSLLRSLSASLSDKKDRTEFFRELDVPETGSPEQAMGALMDAAAPAQASEGRRAVRGPDDITPNEFFTAVRAVASEAVGDEESMDLALPTFLRRVRDRLFQEFSFEGGFNIGPNRHFPRMIAWLRDYEDETNWDEGRGFHIKNASGHGKVREVPVDPNTLKVTIRRDYL